MHAFLILQPWFSPNYHAHFLTQTFQECEHSLEHACIPKKYHAHTLEHMHIPKQGCAHDLERMCIPKQVCTCVLKHVYVPITIDENLDKLPCFHLRFNIQGPDTHTQCKMLMVTMYIVRGKGFPREVIFGGSRCHSWLHKITILLYGLTLRFVPLTIQRVQKIILNV